MQLFALVEINNKAPMNIPTNFSPLITREDAGTKVTELTLLTRSEMGKIWSLDKEEYFVKAFQNGSSFTTKKPIESITVKLDLELDRIRGFSVNIDYSSSDRSRLQKGLGFVESFSRAKTLSVEDFGMGTSKTYDIPSDLRFNTGKIKELVEAIIVIENYTGLKFIIPHDEISYEEFLKIKLTSQIINTRLALYRPLLLMIERQQALTLIKKYIEGDINRRSVLNIGFKADILGHEFVVDNVMLNLAAVKPAIPLDELYQSLSTQKENMVTVKLVSAMDLADDVTLHVESKMAPKTPRDESGFDIPIPQNLSYLYEDLVNNMGESLLSVFSKVQQSLNRHQEPKKILKKLEQLRLLFDLVKYTYDDNTLNYEIHSDIEKQLSILMDQVKGRNFKDAQLRADDIMGIFQTFTDSKKLLRDEGVKDLTMIYTGKRIGDMRIFKPMKS
jgi:hypothetical protein